MCPRMWESTGMSVSHSIFGSPLVYNSVYRNVQSLIIGNRHNSSFVQLKGDEGKGWKKRDRNDITQEQNDLPDCEKSGNRTLNWLQQSNSDYRTLFRFVEILLLKSNIAALSLSLPVGLRFSSEVKDYSQSSWGQQDNDLSTVTCPIFHRPNKAIRYVENKLLWLN